MRRKARRRRNARARPHTESQRDIIARLFALVRSVIDALEFYDCDDAHNDLVRAGIIAEFQAIEGDYPPPKRKR